MRRVAAIAVVCSLVSAAGVAQAADASRRSQMTVTVSFVSACGASVAGLAPVATDLAELRRDVRVSCHGGVPYRVQVLDGRPVAPSTSAPAPLVVSVEF